MEGENRTAGVTVTTLARFCSKITCLLRGGRKIVAVKNFYPFRVSFFPFFFLNVPCSDLYTFSAALIHFEVLVLQNEMQISHNHSESGNVLVCFSRAVWVLVLSSCVWRPQVLLTLCIDQLQLCMARILCEGLVSKRQNQHVDLFITPIADSNLLPYWGTPSCSWKQSSLQSYIHSNSTDLPGHNFVLNSYIHAYMEQNRGGQTWSCAIFFSAK